MRTARGSGPCSATLLVPGGIEALTGGNLYDGTMVATLRNRGWRVDVAEERPRPDVDVVIQDSLSISAGPPDGEAPLVVLLHQVPSDIHGGADQRAAEDAVHRMAGVASRAGEVDGDDRVTGRFQVCDRQIELRFQFRVRDAACACAAALLLFAGCESQLARFGCVQDHRACSAVDREP